MACTILQKQITHIDGKKENIIVPQAAMKKIREDAEKQQAGWCNTGLTYLFRYDLSRFYSRSESS
jgi:hypothetical protein